MVNWCSRAFRRKLDLPPRPLLKSNTKKSELTSKSLQVAPECLCLTPTSLKLGPKLWFTNIKRRRTRGECRRRATRRGCPGPYRASGAGLDFLVCPRGGTFSSPKICLSILDIFKFYLFTFNHPHNFAFLISEILQILPFHSKSC